MFTLAYQPDLFPRGAASVSTLTSHELTSTEPHFPKQNHTLPIIAQALPGYNLSIIFLQTSFSGTVQTGHTSNKVFVYVLMQLFFSKTSISLQRGRSDERPLFRSKWAKKALYICTGTLPKHQRLNKRLCQSTRLRTAGGATSNRPALPQHDKRHANGSQKNTKLA